MSPRYEGVERRQPVAATWDARTVIALIGLFVTTSGGLLASWISLNTQLTTLNVTQNLKFAAIEQHISNDKNQQDRIMARFENLEETVGQIYDKYQRNKGG